MNFQVFRCFQQAIVQVVKDVDPAFRSCPFATSKELHLRRVAELAPHIAAAVNGTAVSAGVEVGVERPK